MTAKTESLFEQALDLSPDEKIKLIGLLLDLVESDNLPPLTPEQTAELDRREALYREDPSRAIPWEEAHAQVREHLARIREERERKANAS